MVSRLPLQRKDWVDAALRRLAASSLDAVRVEVLARDLDKGSFYWHFNDRSELLAAMLQEWEAETDQVSATVAREATPSQRLGRIVQLITAPAADAGRAAIENAIFAWAHQDPALAKRVAAVEAKRIATPRGCSKRSASRRPTPPGGARRATPCSSA